MRGVCSLFSDVLSCTFFTFYKIYNASGAAIRGGFYSKRLSSGRAAEHSTHFYMGARLAVRLLAMAVPHVCLLRLAKGGPYQ